MDFEKEANEAFNYVCGATDACGVFKKGDDLSRKNCECRYNIEQAIRRAYAQGIEDAEKACEKVQRVLREPTREEARALADAGYMPVSEYVRLFGEK